MADWETILFTVLNSASVIVGSCANLLIIVSFFVINSTREPTELFLVSLSVADFLVCAVYQPLLVICFNNPDQLFNQPYRSTMLFFGYSLMTASMNGLLAVNFDRFVAIYLPYKYMTWITEVNTAVIISISWVISIATGILNCFKGKIPGVQVIVRLYTTIIIVLIPILYGAIYKEARKQARRIIEQSMAGARVLPNRRYLTDRATRGVGLVLITTLLCWLPLILSPAFLPNLKADEDGFLRGIWWCVTAGCVNSCINPFIYFYKFSKFRRNVGKLFQMIGINVSGRLPININEKRVNPMSQDPNPMETADGRAAWLVEEPAPQGT
ncbi:hypothetical protein OS493_036469 [Desmophyllum pertusum]|uniref:G-protein coupled receptors family 1 profile domain-containing protein n=1 Tax=Desmophyllum pertusum TaxID=174260 RepID=A0A9W9Y7C5_9CNID|nr:hypothetical protein OS493_036469 [Desmophyllum pertusum]